MKLYIQGQAKSTKDIENDLKDHITEIWINFIMLVLGPNVLTRNHWKHEVYSQIHDVAITKKDKTYPTKQQLYRWLYTDNILDLHEPKKFSKLLKGIAAKEKELPRPALSEYDDLQNHVADLLQKYFDWLSTELSDSG